MRTMSLSGFSRRMIPRIRSWAQQITSHTNSATGPQGDPGGDRAEVEDADPPDDAVGGLGDRTPWVFGLAGGEGDDLAAHEGEDHHENAGEDGARAVGEEAAVGGEVGQTVGGVAG